MERFYCPLDISIKNQISIIENEQITAYNVYILRRLHQITFRLLIDSTTLSYRIRLKSQAVNQNLNQHGFPNRVDLWLF